VQKKSSSSTLSAEVQQAIVAAVQEALSAVLPIPDVEHQDTAIEGQGGQLPSAPVTTSPSAD
jgi:hypothetical protein